MHPSPGTFPSTPVYKPSHQPVQFIPMPPGAKSRRDAPPPGAKNKSAPSFSSAPQVVPQMAGSSPKDSFARKSSASSEATLAAINIPPASPLPTPSFASAVPSRPPPLSASEVLKSKRQDPTVGLFGASYKTSVFNSMTYLTPTGAQKNGTPQSQVRPAPGSNSLLARYSEEKEKKNEVHVTSLLQALDIKDPSEPKPPQPQQISSTAPRSGIMRFKKEDFVAMVEKLITRA